MNVFMVKDKYDRFLTKGWTIKYNREIGSIWKKKHHIISAFKTGSLRSLDMKDHVIVEVELKPVFYHSVY
jgi:hypothetical protein